MFTVFTFGDSVLDCAHYNSEGVTPAGLLIDNRDDLFPEFEGRDLRRLWKGPVQLVHLAQDGATVSNLPFQLRQVRESDGVALVSVGGNDLLRGLLWDAGAGLRAFEHALSDFLERLPVRLVLIANVYDPTVGDDARNFTQLPIEQARGRHRQVNDIIGQLASRHGHLVDLHAHFLRGDASWFSSTIEPSLRGTSEIRRCFLAALLNERAADGAPRSLLGGMLGNSRS